MKYFLNVFFVILGVIFFILILAGAYLFIVDPYNLKPLLFGTTKTSDEVNSLQIEGDKNPNLSEEQEKALEGIGIDPAKIPSSISAEQEACFIEILGEARVEAIKAGESPTAAEYFKARGCL